MAFVPNTDQERQNMLNKIGVKSFDELIELIPDEIKFKGELDLPPKLSEFEALNMMHKYSAKNSDAASNTCYIGGGAYDHYSPAIVGSILQRPEFKTAYTPYQAEVSQGTLQAMYEFQTLICQLTGMEVANASLYDGGGALAEAVLMSAAHNKNKEFIFANSVHPNYEAATETITKGKDFVYKSAIAHDGSVDLDKLESMVGDETSAVIVQTPNFFGNLAPIKELEEITHRTKALLIVVVNPMSLGILEAPGKYNADVVVGEGQVLGIPLSFGGPYLGIFACKQKYVRKIPGRIAGLTKDADGKRAFVLTLQTREQQIKREKATSNICTNQGLFMLAATVYMEALGKQGIKEVSEQSMRKAHYLAEEITKLKGFKFANDKPFFNEFLIHPPVSASTIINDAEKEGILAGIDISRFFPNNKGLLIAVTEKRSKAEMDEFVNFLSRYAS